MELGPNLRAFMQPEHEHAVATVERFVQDHEMLNPVQEAQRAEEAKRLLTRIQADFASDKSERANAIILNAENLLWMLALSSKNDPAIKWPMTCKYLLQKLRGRLRS